MEIFNTKLDQKLEIDQTRLGIKKKKVEQTRLDQNNYLEIINRNRESLKFREN